MKASVLLKYEERMNEIPSSIASNKALDAAVELFVELKGQIEVGKSFEKEKLELEKEYNSIEEFQKDRDLKASYNDAIDAHKQALNVLEKMSKALNAKLVNSIPANTWIKTNYHWIGYNSDNWGAIDYRIRVKSHNDDRKPLKHINYS
jgi:hypothetical protein